MTVYNVWECFRSFWEILEVEEPRVPEDFGILEYLINMEGSTTS